MIIQPMAAQKRSRYLTTRTAKLRLGCHETVCAATDISPAAFQPPATTSSLHAVVQVTQDAPLFQPTIFLTFIE